MAGGDHLHTGTVVRHSPMSPEDAAEVIEALRRDVPGISFAVERHDTGFAHESTYVPRWDSTDPKSVAPVEQLVADGIVKLLARHEGMNADELLATAHRSVADRGSAVGSQPRGGPAPR